MCPHTVQDASGRPTGASNELAEKPGLMARRLSMRQRSLAEIVLELAREMARTAEANLGTDVEDSPLRFAQ